MALLDRVKTSIGIIDPAEPTPATIARSAQLQDIITACKEDLKQAGILEDIVEAEGPFVSQACRLYVRAFLNYQNLGQVWQARYEGYRDGYAMRQDYIAAPDPEI